MQVVVGLTVLSPAQTGDFSRVQPCFHPKTDGILVSTPSCGYTHTVQLPVLSEIRRLLAMSSSLSLNTYSHNAYTNIPARMARLTPETSEPWEVPDGGCRLGACSLTGLVLLDPTVSSSIPGDGGRGRKEWRRGYWLEYCRSTPLQIPVS